MTASTRIHDRVLQRKICSAEEAADHINDGDVVGMSGFTGSGYPKAVPKALADRARSIHKQGNSFGISLFTGASTGPELDGELAQAEAINIRMPYNSDGLLRGQINEGRVRYTDYHLGQMGPKVNMNFLGPMDVAVVELTCIRDGCALVSSSSVGNNDIWLKKAKKIILEVNSWQSEHLEGMHDIWLPAMDVDRVPPIPIRACGDRIGDRYIKVDPGKIVAIVESHIPDRNAPFDPPTEITQAVAGHLIEFFRHEIAHKRMPPTLRPLQSGVGNIANTVMQALGEGGFENLVAYTEVIQDGMIALIDSGQMILASATAFSLSPEAAERVNSAMKWYRDKLILRPQHISNHPEVIRRLGCIAMNGMIEADLTGNINSTRIMGSKVQNGIGGSGDFARQASLSIFLTPSLAKGGKISAIVPRCANIDHVSQDVQIIVTEQGLADLRGLSPDQRPEVIIENCAHPDYRPLLKEYIKVARAESFGHSLPLSLRHAFSWHQRFVETGSMAPN